MILILLLMMVVIRVTNETGGSLKGCGVTLQFGCLGCVGAVPTWTCYIDVIT